jgi:phosphoribosyl-ATP pyrophosphohydrolase
MSTKLELEELLKIIKNKLSSKDNNSYTLNLVKSGNERVIQKVGEEAVEVVISSLINIKNPNQINKENSIKEIADLYFHSLILMAIQDIDINDILKELYLRNKK